jgi:hypothetical protein
MLWYLWGETTFPLHKTTVRLIQGRSEFKGTALNYINIFIAKKSLERSRNIAYWCLLFHVVTISFAKFIPICPKFEHFFMVLFLSKGCEVLDNCFLAMHFGPKIFLTIKSSKIAWRGRNLKVLDQGYVADDAEIPISASGTRPLYRLKCEAMFHHAEASLQLLIILVSFVQ